MSRRSAKFGTESYSKVFPTRLRETFESSGMTRQDIADILGKTRQAVSNYFDGSSSPDWENLALICKTLNVSADYLLGLSGAQSTDQSIQAFATHTGLSGKSIGRLESIRTLEPEILPVLNALLVNPLFTAGLQELTSSLKYAEMAKQQDVPETEQGLSADDEMVELTPAETSRFMLLSSMEYIKDAISSVKADMLKGKG